MRGSRILEDPDAAEMSRPACGRGVSPLAERADGSGSGPAQSEAPDGGGAAAVDIVVSGRVSTRR